MIRNILKKEALTVDKNDCFFAAFVIKIVKKIFHVLKSKFSLRISSLICAHLSLLLWNEM